MEHFKFKHLVTSALAGAAMLTLTIPVAQAATAGPTGFNVTVSLTSVCTVAAIADMSFGTYTAFGSATNTAPTTNVAITCTRGLAAAPTLAFDTPNGVVAGLNYTVSAAAAVLSAGTAATPSPTPNGTADTHNITITGNMPAGQAGTNGAGVQTDVRTVTVTY